MSLLTTLVENLEGWPKGTDAAVNSRFSDVVYFYKLDGEPIENDIHEMVYLVPGALGEYEHISRQEWLEGRVKPDIADHLQKIRNITSKRLSLENKVEGAKDDLLYAQSQLIAFEEDPQNNIYTSIEEAHDLENILYDKAYQDCRKFAKGGEKFYSRKCLINGVRHEALLYVEYYEVDYDFYDIRDYTFEIVKS